jgi:hypothetical protein
MRSNPYQHVFSFIDLSKWAARIAQYDFFKMNTYKERGGLANCVVP